MKFKIVIDLEGDAFRDEPMSEAARILRKLANYIQQYGPGFGASAITDINGNTCGTAKVTK